MEKQNAMLAATLIILVLLMAGCTSPPAPASNPINNTQNLAPPSPTTCSDKDCFIAAANKCENMSISVTDDVGTFSYSSSTACVFTKTLVSLDANESQEMKNLLEGKNLTCIYKRGEFDQRLVTTLLGGMEYCGGELKDNLARLVVFS